MLTQNKGQHFFLTMKLGTHNSMTYLKPKKWYLYPFQFIARCQNKSIEEQYTNHNIRLFDIRITYDKNGIPEFRHGYIAYKGNVYNVLEYLNNQKEPVKVRILLEEGKSNCINEILFIKDINRFKTLYPNISFFEGRRKYDWKKIVDLPDLEVTQLVSSMQGNKLDDLWPWLYAYRMNKKNLELYKNIDKNVLIDFI